MELLRDDMDLFEYRERYTTDNSMVYIFESDCMGQFTDADLVEIHIGVPLDELDSDISCVEVCVGEVRDNRRFIFERFDDLISLDAVNELLNRVRVGTGVGMCWC